MYFMFRISCVVELRLKYIDESQRESNPAGIKLPSRISVHNSKEQEEIVHLSEHEPKSDHFSEIDPSNIYPEHNHEDKSEAGMSLKLSSENDDVELVEDLVKIADMGLLLGTPIFENALEKIAEILTEYLAQVINNII